ncbi:MAG: lipopolysaccharide biosynthesis protein [Rhodospirillaceae bacterium]|nr:lipopolysaccharide biosynthesis protein [Rhodospirillaceae bacterium]
MKMQKEDSQPRMRLGASSARGAMLMLVSQSVVFGTNFVGIAILARLLPPSLFGIMAMAATVSNFIMMFRDFGLTTPVLQRKVLSQDQLSALYWMNVAFGLTLTALTVAAAPAIAWFYSQPDLTLVISVLASGFLIGTTGAMQDALLRRDMRFGAIAIIRIVSSLFTLVAGVTAAFLGYGIWALVIMRLVQQALLGLGCWVASAWRPSRFRRGTEIRSLIGVAGHVTGSQLATYLSRNTDNILIGWQWGELALGFYDQAYKLLMLPMQQIGMPINSVMLPLLSRLSDEPVSYRTVYLRVTEKIVMLAMPLSCLMLVLPETIVRVALGPNWMAAAPVVAWLGIAMIYQPLAFTTNCLLISQNRSGEMLRNSLINSGLSVLSFIVGLPFGPVGVAASYAVCGLILRTPLTLWLVGRRGSVTTADQYRLLVPTVCSGSVLAATYLGLKSSAFFHDQPFLLLTVAAVVALPVTAGALAALPSGRAMMKDSLVMAQLALASLNKGGTRI